MIHWNVLFRWLLLIVAPVLIVVGGGALGLWIYARLILGLTITDVPGMLIAPPQMIVNAEATNPITITLNGYIDATVPFKQRLDLPLKGTYNTVAKFDTDVPVKFTIDYRGVVPVDTYADIEGTTDFTYQNVKRLRNVKFKARLPLRFEQPVHFVVPVNTKLRLAYDGPLRMAVNQTVSGPVDTVLKTRLKAVKDITTPILARFQMRVYPPQEPMPFIIKHSDLQLHLDGLRLEKMPGQQAAQPAAGEGT